MYATIVTSEDEMQQIVELSWQNHKVSISDNEKVSEGFVSWNYSAELLHKMNALHPNIIVKDDNKVVGYALVALKEARHFHPDLEKMVNQLDILNYKDKLLGQYNYYVMGQICIDKQYRGKGIFEILYHKHKSVFEREYDFVVTEISTSNQRSMRAHEKTGFKTIYVYSDALDKWNVVLWDWS